MNSEGGRSPREWCIGGRKMARSSPSSSSGATDSSSYNSEEEPRKRQRGKQSSRNRRGGAGGRTRERRRRAHRAVDRGGSIERDFSRASHAFGESIVVLRAEEEAPREQMPSHSPPDLLRDQEAESGTDVAEEGRTERVNPTVYPGTFPVLTPDDPPESGPLQSEAIKNYQCHTGQGYS